MARAKATMMMRGAKPTDEAHWRVMWADFLTGDEQPFPAEGHAPHGRDSPAQ